MDAIVIDPDRVSYPPYLCANLACGAACEPPWNLCRLRPVRGGEVVECILCVACVDGLRSGGAGRLTVLPRPPRP